MHGGRDPFFPIGDGEALARKIQDARLLVIEHAATAIAVAAIGKVAAEMIPL